MLKLHPIPAFQDNYLWLLYRDGCRGAVVVDPGDAAPVKKELQQRSLALEAILVTHHHLDHTGGVAELCAGQQVPVYGPRSPHIPQVSHPLGAGDSAQVLGAKFNVLAVPGHTMDHIAYFRPAAGDELPLLLCGDTLFAGGCGRLFEGTAQVMWQSLERLRQLPPQTQVCCAHEYTLDNLRFARQVDPLNQPLMAREQTEQRKRQQGRPTLPSTIALEQATNPFLRCREAAVWQAAAERAGGALTQEPAAVFAQLRSWKDNF